MHPVSLERLAGKRVLLLQGPMGPFFKNLDHHLRTKGARTFRICFNGGDRFFASKDNRIDFGGKTVAWEAFITRFLLEKKIDTITINSTVGMASLFHGTPTIVLGKALYDFEGLTCNGLPLGRFWLEYKAPDRKLFGKFRSYLVNQTQLHGSFYSGFPHQLN